MSWSHESSDDLLRKAASLAEAAEHCAREPIHIPGAVQGYGGLLVLDTALRVVQCGGSLDALIGRPPEATVGCELADLFAPEAVARLATVFRPDQPGTPAELESCVPLHGSAGPLHAVAHSHDGCHLLEFWPVSSPLIAPASSWACLRVVTELTGQLHARPDEPAEFCRQVVELLRQVSGYDRVMVYRFNPDWNGEVVAEARPESAVSYLGLRFPASDIPENARELYRQNPLRVMADAAAEPLPLFPRLNPLTGRELDLSFARLRAVSPVHRQYVLNMGMRGTLVASILDGDRLWGLLALHHGEPRVPPPNVCHLVKGIARLIASRLAIVRERRHALGLRTAQELLARLSDELTETDEPEAVLVDPRIGFMNLIRASGTALVRPNQSWSHGTTPAPDDLRRLARWLDQQNAPLVASYQLGTDAPELADLTPVVCGLLAIRITDDTGGWLMWFRPEEVTTVTWGGDPRKGLVEIDGQLRLTPRRSFEAWQEVTRGKSAPWTPEELDLLQEVIRPNLTELLFRATSRRAQRAEANLELMKAVVENTQEGILVTNVEIDPPGPRIVYVNEALLRSTGYSREELIGQSPRLFQGPRTERAVLDRIRQALLRQEPITVELINYRKDGSEFPVELSITPLRDRSGQVTHFVAIQRDITERKQAEEALARSNRQYQLLADHIQDVIALIAADGRMLYVSPSCERLLGYTPQEFIGQDSLLYSHPDDRERLLRSLQDNLEGRTTTQEWRCRKRDGLYLWVETVTTPVRDESGAVSGVVCCTRNIHERKTMEDQLRQAQKLEAVGQFAGGIAHDFNNVLTVVLGCGELLKQDLPPDSPAAALVQDIIRAGERGAALTGQLLTFSRQRVAQVQVFDVADALSAACRMLERLIGENITLVTDFAPDSGSVEADPRPIEQAVVNLVVNARDAMPRGGQVMIRTAAVPLPQADVVLPPECPPGPYVRVTVSDTGEGMPPEVQAHIFEPFFTTKPPGKGTGLGLATVHGIVSQARGFITVQSEPGRGTTFDVYLPRYTGSVAGGQGGAAAGVAATGTTPRQTGGRSRAVVLLVEDDPDIRSLVATFLQGHGFAVVTAETGEEALRLMSERPDLSPDLLLTDVVMPGPSGREVAEVLQRQQPQLRVIYTSGYTTDTVLAHGIEQERVYFLQKPYSLDALLRLVQRVLRGS